MWNFFATNTQPELSNVVAIASDNVNGAALLYDGTVAAWPDPAPTGLTNITAIVGGEQAFLAGVRRTPAFPTELMVIPLNAPLPWLELARATHLG